MVQTIDDIREKAVPILKAAGVTRAGVFGSYARGEQGPESDVDILYKFDARVSLLTVIALERMLTEALGRKVDLVSERGVSPYILPEIMRDKVALYE